jgi:hypothetical protein
MLTLRSKKRSNSLYFTGYGNYKKYYNLVLSYLVILILSANIKEQSMGMTFCDLINLMRKYETFNI